MDIKARLHLFKISSGFDEELTRFFIRFSMCLYDYCRCVMYSITNRRVTATLLKQIAEITEVIGNRWKVRV